MTTAVMINFSCPTCARRFCVPPEMAGRRGSCKKCGGELLVPHADQTPLLTKSATTRIPPRTRRLMADAEQMHSIFRDFPQIRVASIEGDPPEKYRIEYRAKGLELRNGEPIVRIDHSVEVQLTSEYPRLAPKCRMLTPIFHPNIDDAGTICIGDHWVAGERLADLIIRIGEMISYQAYNIKSPLNGEAAMWADLHPDRLPIDPTNLHPLEK